jgi:TetR/AcrR family fatty acid metabolism transcriptional regulator
MPRFSKAQNERIRAILLDRGAQLFAGRSYASVTVEDIAAAAGIAKGTLYRFFHGKEDLFSQVFGREHARFHQHVQGLLAGVDVRRRQDVRNALHAVVRDLAANPLLRRVLDERDTPVWLEVRYDPAGRLGQERASTELLAGLIAAGQRAGVMRAGDPLELAAVCNQLVAGLLVSSSGGGPETLRSLETALDLVVDGLYSVGRGDEP